MVYSFARRIGEIDTTHDIQLFDWNEIGYVLGVWHLSQSHLPGSSSDALKKHFFDQMWNQARLCRYIQHLGCRPR